NGRHDPTMSVENFAATAFMGWFEPHDFSDPNDSSVTTWTQTHDALASQFPGEYPHLFLTDPNGSHGIIDPALKTQGWNWLVQQVRATNPKHVVFTSYWPRRDGAFWAYIDTADDPQAQSRIEALVSTGGAIDVKTQNLTRFHLDLTADLVGSADAA